MIIKKMNIKAFSHAKGMAFSDHYVVILTGRTAVLYDRKTMEALGQIESLSYVYKGYISPNENQLLLVSTGKVFYVYSLPELTLIKKTVLTHNSAGYGFEGLGGYSADGRKIYLVVPQADFTSSIYVYDSETLKKSEVLLSGKRYLLSSIRYIPPKKKFLFSGVKKEPGCNRPVALWYDEQAFTEVALEGKDDFLITEYDEVSDGFQGVGLSELKHFNADGNYIGSTPVCKDEKQEINTMDFFMKALKLDPSRVSDNERIQLEKVLEKLHTKTFAYSDMITLARYSKNKKYLYIVTFEKFYIIRVADAHKVYQDAVEYGAIDLIETEDKIILLCFSGRCRVYAVLEE